MNRRKAIAQLGMSAMWFAASHPFSSRAMGATRKIKNWIWIGPETGKSLDYWKSKLETAKSNGIDAVLLEVYNSRAAFYDTERFPVTEDILSKLMPVCRSLELELHAWMWTMICNVDDIVRKHPEWYAVNGKGESANSKPSYVDYYKFLCPCNEEAQEFIRGNVESLARIGELDGIHLDYVRLPDVIIAPGLRQKYNVTQDREFPEYDYSYSASCRSQFKAKTGIDPLKDLADPAANKEWRQFRYDSVTNLVNDKLVPAAKRHKKTITAAVFPNWQHVRQEWRSWDLDGFMPMLYNNFYNESTEWIARQVKMELADLKTPIPVYAGLFVPALSADELRAAIELSESSGASGISLFALNSMDPEKWLAIRKRS